MMKTFSVRVRRSIDEVYAYAAEPTNLPEWGDGIESVRIVSDGPLGVGTTYVIKNRMGGSVQEFTSEIIAFEPNRLFAFKTSGAFPYTSTRTFEEKEGAVVITEVLKADQPTGLMRVVSPLIMSFASRSHRRSLEELKKILEGDGQS